MKYLRSIPITAQGIVITLFVSVLAWGLLDHFQSRALRGIFLSQIEQRIDSEAQEDRLRFDAYIKAHHDSVKLLVYEKNFTDYVNSPNRHRGNKILFHREVPPWLPRSSVLRSLVSIRYALLLDEKGAVREVYQGTAKSPPPALLKPTALIMQLSHNQFFMTSINGVPFLLASESLRTSGGGALKTRATLMLASPIDAEFLMESQKPYYGQMFALTYNSPGEPHSARILVSTEPKLIPAGTDLKTLENEYLIAGKSFFDYGASEVPLGFASFIPMKEVNSVVGSLTLRDRRQRAVTAGILISVFALIMFGVTKRIERVTKSIDEFSRQALMGNKPKEIRGDELTILEERFRNLTEEVLSSREHLIEAEKFSALGRLTANVAHEIRNPLTSIGGFARRLDKKSSKGTAEKEYAEIITSEVDSLERILKNVLAYSRQNHHLELAATDINETAEESLRVFQERCNELSIAVSMDFGEVPKIDIDRLQVKECLGNLITNAIDSMPEGGALTILTGTEEFRGAKYVVLQVSDTGKGIPQDKLQMIFEPFFTTKVLGRGTGLGLAICKKIMEDHGGFIRVRSAQGKGSTFSMYFPMEKNPAPQELVSVPARHGPPIS